ncbi:MAG: hypothetical protein RJB01_1537 [Actinomycetota bacterium]|jgi:hypothetical protein
MNDRQVRIQGAIDDLVARAELDPGLRERLMAEPGETIWLETGMRVPEHWAVVAMEVDGSIEIALGCDELPEDYLELVSGGEVDPNCGFFRTLDPHYYDY